MDEPALRTIRLTERDREILGHIARYRITTVQAVQRLFFASLQQEAAESTLRRLREAGFIESRRLFETARYYYLTKLATHTLGKAESLARRPGSQSVSTNFGVLAFCCLMPKLRELFTLDEFRTEYAPLFEPGLPSTHYYVDEDQAGVRRLGWIEIDGGADVRRLVRKCHHRVNRRLDLPAFRELIREKNFVVAILTGNPEKAATIRAALESDRPLVEIRLAVCPDLERLNRTRIHTVAE